MTTKSMGDLQIIPVSGKSELERFVRVPMRLNAKDPTYIAPLMSNGLRRCRQHNPFFEHAQVQFWLAVRGGRDVGGSAPRSISLSREEPGKPVGQFGHDRRRDDPRCSRPVRGGRGLAQGARQDHRDGPLQPVDQRGNGPAGGGFETRPS